MPWTHEEMEDAAKVLSEAAKIGPIEKVTVGEDCYVVAGEVTYTDEIYLEALEDLKRKNDLKLDGKTEERESYKCNKSS